MVDNLITGNRQNVPANARFVEQDVTEGVFLDEPVDYVFHFASPASPEDFERYPIQVLKAGALGTHKTLGLAKHKRAKFMLASTSEVYGDPAVSPQPETYWGNVNPIGPRGVYDEAKRYAEAMTMAYRKVHGLDTRIVRIFNTYGPRMRLDDGRVIPNFFRQMMNDEPITIYGDGTQTRSFAFIEDTIRSIMMLSQIHAPEPVNVGSEQEITINALTNYFDGLLGRSIPRLYVPALQDDPKQRRPDLTRLTRLIGPQKTVDLAAGLRLTHKSLLQGR